MLQRPRNTTDSCFTRTLVEMISGVEVVVFAEIGDFAVPGNRIAVRLTPQASASRQESFCMASAEFLVDCNTLCTSLSSEISEVTSWNSKS